MINDFIYSINFYCPFVRKISIDEKNAKVILRIGENSTVTEYTEYKAKIDNIYKHIINKKSVKKVNLYANNVISKYNGDIREELLRNGIVTYRGKGIISFKGIFYELYNIFDDIFIDFALSLNAEEINYPTLIQAKSLDKCNYITSFAQYLTYTTHLVEDFENVKDYIDKRNSNNLANPQYILTPAVCLHCYIGLQNTILDIKNPYVITTKGRCFRYESNNLNGNTRLWDFTMREIVFIGTEEAVETLRQQSMQFVRDLVEILELNCFIETASDPFFIDIKNKEYFQLITKVKYELRMNIPFNNTSIAVASFNSHGNHFGRSYHITSKTGTYVNTGCTAFGIERWVYAFLSQYGLDMSLWPKKMKQLIEKKRQWHGYLSN